MPKIESPRRRSENAGGGERQPEERLGCSPNVLIRNNPDFSGPANEGERGDACGMRCRNHTLRSGSSAIETPQGRYCLARSRRAREERSERPGRGGVEWEGCESNRVASSFKGELGGSGSVPEAGLRKGSTARTRGPRSRISGGRGDVSPLSHWQGCKGCDDGANPSRDCGRRGTCGCRAGDAYSRHESGGEEEASGSGRRGAQK